MNTREKIEITRDGYNKTAKTWDQTRRVFWPELADETIKYFKKSSPEAVLDLGCGNGRLLPILQENNDKLEYFGADISQGLIDIAKERYLSQNFICYDGINLPYENNTFNVIVSIAVLHHLPKNFIDTWIQESKRVAKKDATFIFTSWDLMNTKKEEIKKYYWQNFLKNILHFKMPVFGEYVFGFVKEKQTRFVHAYTQKDLENIFIKNGFKILESKIVTSPKSDDRNILIVCKNI
jgi:ubiquinone/menaquinone biosynthesis C-methylase UbiE